MQSRKNYNTMSMLLSTRNLVSSAIAAAACASLSAALRLFAITNVLWFTTKTTIVYLLFFLEILDNFCFFVLIG